MIFFVTKNILGSRSIDADAAVSHLERHHRPPCVDDIAGALLVFNREARGHAAGLRTTILVALAASIAMI